MKDPFPCNLLHYCAKY